MGILGVKWDVRGMCTWGAFIGLLNLSFQSSGNHQPTHYSMEILGIMGV
jgi:hypothetical protein